MDTLNAQLEILIGEGLAYTEAQAAFAARQPAHLNAYRDGVKVRDGELEVDDDAIVSEAEGGAYVQAWVWVPDSALT